MCVFITAVPITKPLAWGEGSSGGYVLRETTSRELKRRMCVPIWDKFWVMVFVELSHRTMIARESDSDSDSVCKFRPA